MRASPFRHWSAFTLAELLIALAILGIIATFTIPKVLQSQQSSRFTAIGKETAAMVEGAFQAYKQTGSITTNSKLADFTPYMNYVARDTASLIDNVPTLTSQNCSLQTCYRLHNGAILWWWGTDPTMDGLTSTNALEFMVDPDGVYSNSTTTPGKSVQFYLYANGRITDRGNVNTPTWVNAASYGPNSGFVPDWWTWN